MSVIIDVKQQLRDVRAKIEKAAKERPEEYKYIEPTLLAVTKTKPLEVIIEAYEEGQRHFGENYVQELEEKSKNPVALERCPDIKWHFIGHLQTNKINKLLSVPNLHMIETVHSQNLASSLDKSWPKFGPAGSKLNVMVQINTSGEDAKNGIPPTPEQVLSLTQYVLSECPNLNLEGFMTIGKIDHDPAEGPNPDFITLKICRDEVCRRMGMDPRQFHLSMGMTTDYDQAITMGSTHVRVGRAIFGPRGPRLYE